MEAGGKAHSAPFSLLFALCRRAEGLSQGFAARYAAHGCALDTKEYEVIIGGGLHYGEEIAKVKKPCKVVVVSDDIVFSLYGEKCVNELKKCGYEVLSFVFPNGEKSKNLSTAEQVLSFCAENGISKSDLLVALGGGVTGDLTGFVASVF